MKRRGFIEALAAMLYGVIGILSYAVVRKVATESTKKLYVEKSLMVRINDKFRVLVTGWYSAGGPNKGYKQMNRFMMKFDTREEADEFINADVVPYQYDPDNPPKRYAGANQ